MIIGKLFKKIENHLKFMKCINIYMKIHLSILSFFSNGQFFVLFTFSNKLFQSCWQRKVLSGLIQRILIKETRNTRKSECFCKKKYFFCRFAEKTLKKQHFWCDRRIIQWNTAVYIYFLPMNSKIAVSL